MEKTLHLISALALLCIPAVASAQYFETGGIGYNVLSATDHTVEVVPLSSGTSYRGNITIPATVTYGGDTYDVVALGTKAFYGGTLTRVTIPSSVLQIKSKCFQFAAGPSSITVPASVTDIGMLSFAAYNMTSINVDEDNPNYRSIGGILFSKDTSTVVECPMGKSGTVNLPQNVRHFAPYAFAYCQKLTGVTIPDGLLSIGLSAFIHDNRLNNLAIPASLLSMGVSPFSGCSALTNLSIAEGNSHYYMDGMAIYSAGGDTLVSCHKSADSVFLPNTMRVVAGFNSNTDIKYVHIPEGATKICDNAFGYSSLRSIDLPSQMHLIDDWAFYGCSSLSQITMPDYLDSMGSGCFHGCSHLTSVDIPDGLRTIPYGAFFMCTSLSNITWGNAVEIIDTSAFGDCSFTELTLPPTLHAVRHLAFIGDYQGSLNRLTFSAPVDTIEVDAFYLQPLRMLRLRNTVPPVTTDDGYGTYGCLDGTDADSIVVPCGSLNAWLSDSYWGQFADKYVEDCNIGIEETHSDRISISTQANGISIHGATGEPIYIFDAVGRQIYHTSGVTEGEPIPLPSTGVYIVKVGNDKARKVISVR